MSKGLSGDPADHLTVADWVRLIEARFQYEPLPLRVFWLASPSSRNELARDIESYESVVSIVPLIVHGRLFENANEIGEDLVRLLEDNRERVEGILNQAQSSREIALVLISRTRMGLAQVNSPVDLPEWFPSSSRGAMEVRFEDLLEHQEVPIDHLASKLGLLRQELLRLERLLVTRLEGALETDAENVDKFLKETARTRDIVSPGDFVARAFAHLSSVKSDEGFRPRAGRESVVGRIWALHLKSSLDVFTRACDVLGDALYLPEAGISDYYECLPAVVLRPGPEVVGRARLARNLLISTSWACQLSAAAAHAGDYGRYPPALLVSSELDLIRSIASMRPILDSRRAKK